MGPTRRTAAVAHAAGTAGSTRRQRHALGPQLLRRRQRDLRHRQLTLHRRQGVRPVQQAPLTPLLAKTARLRPMAAAVLAVDMAESTSRPLRPALRTRQRLRGTLPLPRALPM